MEHGNRPSALNFKSFIQNRYAGWRCDPSWWFMTGGKTKQYKSCHNEKESDEIAGKLDAERARVALARKEYDQANREREEAARYLQEKRYSAAALEPVVDARQNMKSKQ